MDTIKISVDEKACVGCSLCVEVCPTKVFENKNQEKAPVVVKEKECFGCLSCAEICPATAIIHTNLPMSISLYHDPEMLQIVKKMGKPLREKSFPQESEVIEKSMKDLGTRLLSVAAVLKQALGSSLPSVGTASGLSLAVKLPRYQSVKTLEDAFRCVKETFSPAWELFFEEKDGNLTIRVEKCFIRTLCKEKSIKLGDDLCVLFYNYMAGYFSKVSGKRPRLTEMNTGDQNCTYNIKIY